MKIQNEQKRRNEILYAFLKRTHNDVVLSFFNEWTLKVIIALSFLLEPFLLFFNTFDYSFILH